jgi:hypothetical protein
MGVIAIENPLPNEKAIPMPKRNFLINQYDRTIAKRQGGGKICLLGEEMVCDAMRSDPAIIMIQNHRYSLAFIG